MVAQTRAQRDRQQSQRLSGGAGNVPRNRQRGLSEGRATDAAAA
jgi:hypothetical protein